MKKTLSIISLCVAIILCIPSVPALASNDSGYILYLTNSGNNYSGDLKTVADCLYKGDSSINSSSNVITSSKTYLDSLDLSQYVVISYDGGFDGSGRSDYINGLVSFDGITDGKMYAVQLNYDVCKHILVTSSTPFTASYRSLNLYNYSVGTVTTVNSGSIVGSSTIYCVLLNYYNGYFNQTMPSGITNNMSNSNMVNIHQSNNGCFIRFSSLPVYSIFENSAIGLTGNNDTHFYFSDYVSHLFDDFDYTCINETVNALTLDGVQNGYNTDVVVPDVVYESNSNHMYFQNCSIGFCEPYNQNDFGNFGGAYTYIRYQVDDWVINHISDYTLSTTIYATVGNDRFTGTVNRPLDRDGCITIPFNAFHGGQSTIFSHGFTTSITKQKIEENFNKCYLCSIAPSEIVDFVGAMKSGLQPSNNDLWGMLNTGVIPYAIFYTSGGITAGLNDILSENSEEINTLITAGMAKYKPYTINISCKLVDNNGNESGIFGKTFDLVSGGDVTSDTGGLVNDDPWMPDTDDPNFLPTVPDSNSTTPSAVVYTGGTFSGSFNGVIGYDPGYTELKNDVNSNPNGNFSQYLDPMHNDDVGSWFMSFVNEMPTEMKSILIAGVGVGVLFGLYRFIRRG